MKTFMITVSVVSTLFSLVTCNTAQAKDNQKIDNNKVDISGYFMVDYDNFDKGFLEDKSEPTTKTDIRRARISFKTELVKDWKAKLSINYSDDETEIKDAYAQYKGWNWANLTIGQQKEPFGLEKLTSLRNQSMVERSLVSNALAPSRSIGVNLNGGFSSFNWDLGYFLPNETETASAVTGRLTWLAWQQDDNRLHLGAALSERDLNGSEFRINETMEVNFSDSLIEGEKLNADTNSLQSIELLWQFHGFTTMAEWQQSQVTDINDLTYDYQGGYVQLSYLLSGNNRQYKNGRLGSVSDSDWEFTTRFSTFDMNEENHQSDIYSVGVNYYPSKKLKLMANYIKAEQIENNIELGSNKAISLRMQYSF